MKVNSKNERRAQCATKSGYARIRVHRRDKSRERYLYIRFAREADDHKEQDGNDVVVEAGPVVDFEGCHKGTHQHKKDRAGSQNRTTCFN